MEEKVFTSPQAREIIEYVRRRYGDQLEFLWQRFPRNAIWRNPQNRKWYAALLVAKRSKLGVPGARRAEPSWPGPNSEPDPEVEILDLRFDRGQALDFAASQDGIYPGYHMNKLNWITVILDGSVPTAQITELLDRSYQHSLKS